MQISDKDEGNKTNVYVYLCCHTERSRKISLKIQKAKKQILFAFPNPFY